MLHMPLQSENYSNNNNNNNNNNSANRNSRSSTRRKPFLFLSNILRRKKILKIDDIMFDREMNHRARSEPSVISYSCTKNLGVPRNTSPSVSTLSLTPGRCRDIDEDMQALRLSRQDNPFIKKVLVSRESLVDSMEEIVSDDAILMSEDFNAELDSDPFTLPEVHEHMIRSPPPTHWPRSPRFSLFNFSQGQDNNGTISSQSSEDSSKSAIYIKNTPKLTEIFSTSHQHDLDTIANTSRAMTLKNHKKEDYSRILPRPHCSRSQNNINNNVECSTSKAEVYSQNILLVSGRDMSSASPLSDAELQTSHTENEGNFSLIC